MLGEKLILTPNPGFTLSWLEQGPVKERIANGFSNKVTLNYMSSRISISSCVVQVVSGRRILAPIIANNATEEAQAAHLHNQETLLSLEQAG